MLPINIYTNLAIQKAQCETRHKRLKRAQLAHLARQKHCLNIRPDVPYKIQRAKNQITESHKLNCLSEFYANELLTEVIGIKNPIATSISIYAKALIQLQKNDTSELDPAAKRALIISKNFLEQNVFSTLLRSLHVLPVQAKNQKQALEYSNKAFDLIIFSEECGAIDSHLTSQIFDTRKIKPLVIIIAEAGYTGCEKLGFDILLQHPFSIREIIKVIKEKISVF